MLAASLAGSNVPPDDLEPPPIVAVATRAADGLGIDPAGCGAQPDPAPVAQQHAVRKHRDGPPLSVTPQRSGAAVCPDADRPAAGPGGPQADQFHGNCAAPQGTTGPTPGKRPRQGHERHQAQ